MPLSTKSVPVRAPSAAGGRHGAPTRLIAPAFQGGNDFHGEKQGCRPVRRGGGGGHRQGIVHLSKTRNGR